MVVLLQSYITGTSAAKIASSVEAALNSGRVLAGTLLPPVRRAAGELGVSAATVAAAYRLLVVILWRNPKTARLLRRAATTYRKRREALISELSRRGVPAFGSSGINVWIPVNEETVVVQTLLQCGWAVRAAESYRLKSGPAIRITTAALEPREAIQLAEDIEGILRPRLRESTT